MLTNDDYNFFTILPEKSLTKYSLSCNNNGQYLRKRKSSQTVMETCNSNIESTIVDISSLNENYHQKISSNCGYTLAALATAVLASGVEAMVNLNSNGEHESSTFSSSSPAHHKMHQHHHSYQPSDPSKEINKINQVDFSSGSLTNTVRRISLNILNSSTSAIESLRTSMGSSDDSIHSIGHNHQFRSSSVAGSYHNGDHINYHFSDSSSEKSSTETSDYSGVSPSEFSTSSSTNAPVASTLTTTYSYLTDFFPRILPNSLSINLNQKELPSSSTLNTDYMIDDYDTIDSLTESESHLLKTTTLAAPSTDINNPVTTTATSSSELFMKLMRNVLNTSGEYSEDSTSNLLNSRSHHHHHHHSHHQTSSGDNVLFTSHLLSGSDPLAASSSPSSSSSLSSASSSMLIPSLMTSSFSASAVSDSSAATTAAFSSAVDRDSSYSGSSSHYQHILNLFHLSPQANGTIPAAISSALTSSQLVAASSVFDSSLVNYNSVLDSTLTHNLIGSNISSATSSALTTTSAVLSSSIASSIEPSASVGSSSSYYASEMASSFATLMMNEYTATVASSEAVFEGTYTAVDIFWIVLKVILLGSIILAAILGNMLVIISVLR